VRGHLEPGKCRRRPWVDEIVETTIVKGDAAELVLEALPARFVGTPGSDGTRFMTLHGEPAITISSPITGIAPRRWLQVAMAAVEERGPDALASALDTVRFPDLEAKFAQPEVLIVCPDCGDTVERRGLANHQIRSTRCRWAHAAHEVRLAWQQGWRDPYSLPRGTPLSWTELQRTVRWRNRIRAVRFPNWTAVLLSPPSRW
jgi:hypothetical protein